MCDTILALPGNASERAMLFGKNSDRQRNEAQTVEFFRSTDYAQDATVACTYITIEQVRHTHAVMLCRPFWIWGAEMGANEHGVVIGNEGLQARCPAPQEPALVGMDLLRLALERASTAAEAVEVITTLLERHGQGGDCGHLTRSYYNNGFVVADAHEAFILETVGRQWLLERVQGVRSVSNGYSIGRTAQSASAGLAALIRDSGWSCDDTPNYAEVIGDPNREHLGNAGARRACSTALLNLHDGRLTVADMMSILRDHGSGDRHHPEWEMECATARRTLCMHAGAADKPGQTVGSMVSQVNRDHVVHWVTGTAAPCTSIFKPVLMDVPLPAHGPHPTDRYDPQVLWWRHERLHRAAISGDFARFVDDIHEERDVLESQFQHHIKQVLNGGSLSDRARVVADCWRRAHEVEDRWRTRVAAVMQSSRETPYLDGWAKMNQLAGIDDPGIGPTP